MNEPDPIEPMDEETEERLSTLIADGWVEKAIQGPGPIRLRALQAAGIIPENATQEQIGQGLGTSRTNVQAIERRALIRLRPQFESER